MTLPSPLTRLLAVVIVMIAAVFGASAAQAHEGHAHHAPAAVTAKPVATPPVARPAEAVAAVTAKAIQVSLTVDARTPRAKVAQAPAERPCNGSCCSRSASCCVPGAVLSATTATLPTLVLAARMHATTEPFLAGIAREALPKPPRPLA